MSKSLVDEALLSVLSRDFYTFVKSMEALECFSLCTSLDEGIEKLKSFEVKLRETVASTGLVSSTAKRKQEVLCICFYFYIYGFNMDFLLSFVQGECANAATEESILTKRVCYLLCSLILSETDQSSDKSLMLTNSLVKDLDNSDVRIVSMALQTVSSLQSYALFKVVQERIITHTTTHPSPVIRKNAVDVIHSYAQDFDALPLLKKLLTDPDFGVMASSLKLLQFELRRGSIENPSSFIKFICSVINQINEGKISEDYTYNSMRAPWIHCDLLRILSIIVSQTHDLQDRVDIIYITCLNSERLAKTGSRMSNAVLFECYFLFSKLYHKLSAEEEHMKHKAYIIEKMRSFAGTFLRSQENDKKYTGLTILHWLIRISPESTLAMQNALLTTLKTDSDISGIADRTLQEKAADILLDMVNVDNVKAVLEVIATDYMGWFVIKRLTKLSSIIMRYSSDEFWKLIIMLDILLIINPPYDKEFENAILKVSMGEIKWTMELFDKITSRYRKLISRQPEWAWIIMIVVSHVLKSEIDLNDLEVLKWLEFCFDNLSNSISIDMIAASLELLELCCKRVKSEDNHTDLIARVKKVKVKTSKYDVHRHILFDSFLSKLNEQPVAEESSEVNVINLLDRLSIQGSSKIELPSAVREPRFLWMHKKDIKYEELKTKPYEVPPVMIKKRSISLREGSETTPLIPRQEEEHSLEITLESLKVHKKIWGDHVTALQSDKSKPTN
jgi:hypothetical protein